MKSLRILAPLAGVVLTVLLTTSSAFADPGCFDDAQCDDGNLCTADSCDQALGCQHVSIADQCDDGNLCTTDSCDPQLGCVSSPIAESACDDSSECTFDSCAPSVGCTHVQRSCDDDNPCTVDSCDDFLGCQSDPVDCDDLNRCTDDACDPQIGCTFTDVVCDDHDACTVESCDPVNGCASTPLDCDDQDACTLDACDAELGCRHTRVSCNDENACTIDFCDAEIGCGHKPIDCDDDNFCTIDSCDAHNGCRFSPVDCDDSNLCTIDFCDKTDGCHSVEGVECNDGSACTVDACSPEEGCTFTAIACDDHDPCTVESCDAETGCASSPPIDCDDHDACTADACDGQGGCTHTPLTSCAPPPDLDHFQCYESHRPPLNKKGVSLDDQFGASTVVVKRAKRLCAPANKNGEDPDAVEAEGHLTAYTIKQSSPHFDGKSDITVVNQFGTTALDLYRPERMLVPTSKSLTGPPNPLTQPLDHFKCYRVRGARFRRKGVTVETQFGPETVDIKQPRHLCAPADKNDEDPDADTHALHLMCYQVRAEPQRPRGVFTLNQFGPDAYDIFGLRELCVPSFKNPGTCGDGSINAPGEVCERPGEVCASDGRKCTTDCKCPAPSCGDGIKNGTEACDPAGSVCDPDGRLCNTDCTCPAPTCGDKIVDVELGEECDDGNIVGDDGCGPTCLEERCIPSQEICDGADNDCDGDTDEGNPGGGAPCITTSPGVCAAGTISCVNGALVCQPTEPSGPEICDGKDNDCDGETDEGNPGGGAPCITGLPGECSPGVIACTDGALSCVGDPPALEICGDAKDNDCDGVTDEDCCGPGDFTCNDGACFPDTGVCDGVEDCSDGSDEAACTTNGTGCSTSAECASGNCVDGVCCDAPCTGLCQACSAAKKGSGVDGTCGAILAGSDPDDECAGSNVCNGSGACKAQSGSACALAVDCLSGNCVDGVCCTTPCGGICQACNVAGSIGTCAFIPDGTDPSNECAGPSICNGGGGCRP